MILSLAFRAYLLTPPLRFRRISLIHTNLARVSTWFCCKQNALRNQKIRDHGNMRLHYHTSNLAECLSQMNITRMGKDARQDNLFLTRLSVSMKALLSTYLKKYTRRGF
jgi:hypothetical protein